MTSSRYGSWTPSASFSQCCSHFLSVMWSSLIHSTNLNGPHPTGFRAKSSPAASAALVETIIPARSVSRLSSGEDGPFRLNLTVRSSTTSTDAMSSSSPLRSDFGWLFIRSTFALTEAALNGSPSWYLTPDWSLKTTVFGSGCSHDFARPGAGFRSVPSRTSESKTPWYTWRSWDDVDRCGSRVVISLLSAIRMVPPGIGLPAVQLAGFAASAGFWAGACCSAGAAGAVVAAGAAGLDSAGFAGSAGLAPGPGCRRPSAATACRNQAHPSAALDGSPSSLLHTGADRTFPPSRSAHGLNDPLAVPHAPSGLPSRALDSLDAAPRGRIASRRQDVAKPLRRDDGAMTTEAAGFDVEALGWQALPGASGTEATGTVCAGNDPRRSPPPRSPCPLFRVPQPPPC